MSSTAGHPEPQPASPAGDILLYESPSPWKIRALTWFLGLVMVFALWASVGVLRHMTADPELAMLAPLSWRITFAVIIAGIGAGFFGGILLYLRFYATRLSLSPQGEVVRVETLRLWGRRECTITASQIVASSFNRGRFSSDLRPTVEVDAPWIWVRVRGARGFLLDAQGRFLEPEILGRLLGGAAQTR